ETHEPRHDPEPGERRADHEEGLGDHPEGAAKAPRDCVSSMTFLLVWWVLAFYNSRPRQIRDRFDREASEGACDDRGLLAVHLRARLSPTCTFRCDCRPPFSGLLCDEQRQYDWVPPPGRVCLIRHKDGDARP